MNNEYNYGQQNNQPNINDYIPQNEFNTGSGYANVEEISTGAKIGWGLLGCCIPIVGLVLFLVWRDTKPASSKAAGIGALISVIITVVFYILSFVGIIAAGSMM